MAVRSRRPRHLSDADELQHREDQHDRGDQGHEAGADRAEDADLYEGDAADDPAEVQDDRRPRRGMGCRRAVQRSPAAYSTRPPPTTARSAGAETPRSSARVPGAARSTRPQSTVETPLMTSVERSNMIAPPGGHVAIGARESQLPRR